MSHPNFHGKKSKDKSGTQAETSSGNCHKVQVLNISTIESVVEKMLGTQSAGSRQQLWIVAYHWVWLQQREEMITGVKFE